MYNFEWTYNVHGEVRQVSLKFDPIATDNLEKFRAELKDRYKDYVSETLFGWLGKSNEMY